MAESARNDPVPDRWAWQAELAGPVALRKAWAQLLDKEEWTALDTLVTVVPRAWSAILLDMPEVAAHLPQTQALFRADDLERRTATESRGRQRRRI